MADTIDINVYPTVETVNFEVTENLTTININQVTSSGAVTSVNEMTGDIILTTNSLSNDSGYITNSALSGLVPYTGAVATLDLGSQNFEAHSIVTKTQGETKKMTLSSTNVDADHTAEWQNKDYTGIADITDIPTNTSQLTNNGEDGVHPFIDLRSVPTLVSELTNDSGYITASSIPDISGKMDISVYDTDASGVVDNAEKMTTIGRNATASILYKGTIVYISGSTGNRPNFVKAQANSEATSSGTFGVCIEDIAINSDGRVATIGTLGNLDTRTTAVHPFTSDTLADGDTLYLSPTTAGYVTNTKPSAPNHLVYIGKVARTSPTLGTIVYRMQNGYELDEIHDVSITSKANNDVLQYESASSLWKNKALTTASVASSTDKNYVTDTQLTAIGTISSKLSGYIYKNTTVVAVTGTTSETQVLQITIPANTFSATDIMKIEILVTKSGTAGIQTTKVKLSTSATMPSGTTDQIATAGITNTNLYSPLIRNVLSINGGNISGYNFTTSQTTDIAQSSIAYSTKAFDVTVVNYLYVSITNSSSGDTSTLRSVLISNL